jgi:uncharacterized protein (DUF58 family)
MNGNRGKRVWGRLQPGLWVFLVIVVLLLLAAWNTGANLLYMVLGMVVSFLVLSMVLARATLRGLVLSRTGPPAVFRGDAAPVVLRLENRKWFLPAISLRVEHAPERRPGRGFLARASGGALPLPLGEGRGEGGFLAHASAGALGYVLKLPAQRAAQLSVQEVFPRRGVHSLPAYDLVSSFPFGLVERRRRYADELEVMVYPRVRPVRARTLEQAQGGCRQARRALAEGDEYFGLREYERGDEIRHIAWRISARLGVWMVRELAAGSTNRVTVILDSRQVKSLVDFEDRFEEAVELAASFATSLLYRQCVVSVVTPGGSIPGAVGTAQQRKVLELLARVQVVPAEDYPGFESEVVRREHQDSRIIYISPDPGTWGRNLGAYGIRALDPESVIYA